MRNNLLPIAVQPMITGLVARYSRGFIEGIREIGVPLYAQVGRGAVCGGTRPALRTFDDETSVAFLLRYRIPF